MLIFKKLPFLGTVTGGPFIARFFCIPQTSDSKIANTSGGGCAPPYPTAHLWVYRKVCAGPKNFNIILDDKIKWLTSHRTTARVPEDHFVIWFLERLENKKPNLFFVFCFLIWHQKSISLLKSNQNSNQLLFVFCFMRYTRNSNFDESRLDFRQSQGN